MSNSVELVFNKTITKLAGFIYGEDIFKEQVKDKINILEPCEIIFPSHIEKIASSFIQGFFAEMVDTIGYQRIEDNVTIVTANENLTRDIWNKLF